MQLPQDLQSHFATKPTLLVVGDHVLAHLYLIAGDAVEEIDAIGVPRERKSDKEGGFVGNDSGSIASTEDHVELERRREFVTLVADAMVDAIESGSAERFMVAMQADLAHAIKAQVPEALHERFFREVHVNVVHESVVDVIKRCLAA